jgi:hypothetical protein
MSSIIQILNQVFEMQEKLIASNNDTRFDRNINKILAICEQDGFSMHNPINEKFTDSRTDCDANIVGKLGSTMMVTQVVKPIIYQNMQGQKTIVQKGIVMIESK